MKSSGLFKPVRISFRVNDNEICTLYLWHVRANPILPVSRRPSDLVLGRIIDIMTLSARPVCRQIIYLVSSFIGAVSSEHEEGEHDDGIFAAAISLQVVRGLQTMTDRSRKRFQNDAEASRLPSVDIGPFGGQRFTTGSVEHLKPLSIDDL